MHVDTVVCLVSPCCGTGLSVSRTEAADRYFQGELYEGELACDSCRAAFPVVRGVAVLLPSGKSPDAMSRRNQEVFNFAWKRAEKMPLDDFRWKELFAEDVMDEARLPGGVVLEVGTGPGRFLPFILEAGPAMYIGIDLSDTLFHTYSSFAPRAGKTRFALVQADVRVPTIKPAMFDFILAARILHHVPEPIERLAGLIRYIRPGGQLTCSIFVRNDSPLSRKVRGCVESLKKHLKRCSVETVYRWTLFPAVLVYVLVHAVYPFLERIPGARERLPFRRAFRQWRRLRFPGLRLFVVFDLLASEIEWFSEEALLQRLSGLPVSRYERSPQNEATWTIRIEK